MRASAPARQRECQRADYDSRRTGNRFLDTGSTPVISTLEVMQIMISMEKELTKEEMAWAKGLTLFSLY